MKSHITKTIRTKVYSNSKLKERYISEQKSYYKLSIRKSPTLIKSFHQDLFTLSDVVKIRDDHILKYHSPGVVIFE